MLSTLYKGCEAISVTMETEKNKMKVVIDKREIKKKRFYELMSVLNYIKNQYVVFDTYLTLTLFAFCRTCIKRLISR